MCKKCEELEEQLKRLEDGISSQAKIITIQKEIIDEVKSNKELWKQLALDNEANLAQLRVYRPEKPEVRKTRKTPL